MKRLLEAGADGSALNDSKHTPYVLVRYLPPNLSSQVREPHVFEFRHQLQRKGGVGFAECYAFCRLCPIICQSEAR